MGASREDDDHDDRTNDDRDPSVTNHRAVFGDDPVPVELLSHGSECRGWGCCCQASHAELGRENPPQEREAGPEAENQTPEVAAVVGEFVPRHDAPIIKLESGASRPNPKKTLSTQDRRKCLKTKDLRRAGPRLA